MHEAEKASLGISLKDDKVLLHCFSGCETADILRATNLTMTDFFVRSNGTGTADRPPLATYLYRDAQGVVRYRKDRHADKQFYFAQPNGENGWIRNVTGITRLAYRLNEIVGHTAIFIAEGEKDVDTLWSRGLAATTNDDGA